MCCLFGLMDCNHTLTGHQKARLVSCLALESEARGTDATGAAYNSSGRLCIYKRPGPAHLLHFHLSGIYLYASTEAILRQAVARTWLRREQAEKVHVNSGDIVQIDLCGNIRTDYFDMGWAPYPHWGSWGQFSSCLSSPEPCYLEQLKNVAASFGYTAEQIDQLLMEGWSTDEIEDAMCGYDYL